MKELGIQYSMQRGFEVKRFMFGTSLVRNLHIEGMKTLVWDPFLLDLHAINFGVGGDKCFDTANRI